MTPGPAGGERSLTVAVPTRNRAGKLARCLGALAAARARREFDVVVCDSSTDSAEAEATAAAVAQHPWARYVPHSLDGPCAARNLGAHAATGELLAYVDDDVYVEPDAITILADAVEAAPGPAVIAGTLNWGDEWTGPQVMRPIGYAREAEAGEPTEWLISALLCCRRSVVLECPWDEDRRYYDDRFTSLLWRRHGVELGFCPQARAHHDEERKEYPLAQERHRIYANLFDAIFIRRSPRWALAFEFVGFAAAVKRFARTPRGAIGIVAEWARGNVRFLLDLPRLRRAGLPGHPVGRPACLDAAP